MAVPKHDAPGGPPVLDVVEAILTESMSGFGTTPLRFRDDVGSITDPEDDRYWRAQPGAPARDLDERPSAGEL